MKSTKTNSIWFITAAVAAFLFIRNKKSSAVGMIEDNYHKAVPNRNALRDIIKLGYDGVINKELTIRHRNDAPPYKPQFILSDSLADKSGLPKESYKKANLYAAYRQLKQQDNKTLLFQTVNDMSIKPMTFQDFKDYFTESRVHFVRQAEEVFNNKRNNKSDLYERLKYSPIYTEDMFLDGFNAIMDTDDTDVKKRLDLYKLARNEFYNHMKLLLNKGKSAL